MRRTLTAILLAGLSLNTFGITASHASDAAGVDGPKEWTLLVYLNGHNNLDSFGALNINQMEQVGSTKDLNVVVQWASEATAASTKRLYVKKDNDTNNVTSPVVQDLGKVDMGDWRTLVEFVRWGVAAYPAKHYMIDVWDHGSGWHAIQLHNELMARPGNAMFGGFNPLDISWDDDSGNHITTAQLGQAMTESAKIIGHKVDLYASDACLMAMAEVANEMANSVEIYAGSEEVEPGAGWPYDALLKRWAAKPTATAAEVGGYLADEYVKSYMGGENGTSDATYSVFDMSKLPALQSSVAALGSKLLKLDANDRKAVVTAAGQATAFSFADYVDLGDFLAQIESARAVDGDAIAAVRNATNDFVIANHDTDRFAKAKGVSIWLPTSQDTFNSYSSAYQALQFDHATHWSDALKYVLQDATGRR
jgi:hypothetical protein